jgi:hypothetical protein
MSRTARVRALTVAPAVIAVILGGGLLTATVPAAAATLTGPVQTTLPFTGLKDPSEVAVDAAGDVYVADSGNNRVVELPAGSSTQQVLPFSGLDDPTGVAVDAAGDVYVAELGDNEVVELPAGSSTQQVLPITGLDGAAGVAVDAAGNVYVTSAFSDQVVELPAGSSTQGVLPFSGLNEPLGVAVDAAGDVYVGSYGNPFPGNVQELPAGASAAQVLPVATTAPSGVAVDSAGDLFVSDPYLDQLYEVPLGGSQQTMPYDFGYEELYADAVDPAGDVYATDDNGNRVIEFSGYTTTSTTVTSTTPATPVTGQPFTVGVSVTAASGGLAPSGQVTVTDGQGGSCTATLSPGTGSAAGRGTGSCQLTETTAGPYTLTASYPGDGAFSDSSGTDSVNLDAAPAFVMASPPATASAGQSYGYTFVASGTPAPSYALAAGAPSWLSIDPSTGALSGTVPPGTTSFGYSVTAANAAGTATAGPFAVTVVKAPPPQADLSSQLSCPRTLVPGGSADCTLTVHNAGPASASGVIAATALSLQLRQLSCNLGCVTHGNVTVWKLGSLAAGASATVGITITAVKSGTGLVLGVAGSPVFDPRPLNNLALAVVTISR